MTLIGHRLIRQHWRTLCDRGVFPSAALLIGPDGIGKRTLAEETAARLLGVTHGSLAAHPDVLRPRLHEQERVRDALVTLLFHAHARPIAAPVRVLLLEDIDRLSVPAQALLLKTVEDAPSSTRVFLTAQYRARVLIQLRSRVPPRTLAPVSDDELRAGLRAEGRDARLVEHILPLAGGRPGLAHRLLDDATIRALYEAWGETLQHRTPPELREVAQAEAFLTFVASRLRAAPTAAGIRRLRDGAAMLRQHVPVEVVLEYVGVTAA